MATGSIQFNYDPATGVRTAVYFGEITDEILVDAYRTLITSPDFVPLAHDLADLRGVDALALTPDGLRDLGAMLTGPAPAERPAAVAGLAMVASTPASFGLARMYELMTERFLPKQTRVFRDFDEAREWLATLPRLSW
jgi:hypothetical protein